MKVEIEIPDRTYKEIVEMCEFNSITFDDYAVQCIMDNYYIMKYGDLNEKLKTKEEEKPKEETPTVPVVEEEAPVMEEKPKKKVGRPKKVKEEEKPKVEKKPVKVEEKVVQPQVTDATDVKLQNKIKRTRTLKVK